MEKVEVFFVALVTEIREMRGLTVISLDGCVWLRVKSRHFGKLPLEEGKHIDPEEYTDRMAALQFADCYEAGLCVLDQAACTTGDMKRKLMRKGFVEAAAEAAVEKLIEVGFLDDLRYAERMAQSQLKKPVGAYAVKRKLRAKYLSEEAVEAAMEGFDEEQQSATCRTAAEKLYRKYASLPPREGRAKLSQALARRGFSWDAISAAVEETISGWDDFEE